jgi:PAS domain S-box-containing protein
MSYDHVVNIIRELRSNLSAAPINSGAQNSHAIFEMLVSFLGKHFNATYVVANDLEEDADYTYAKPKSFYAGSIKSIAKKDSLELPVFISDVNKSRASQALLTELIHRNINSFAATLIYSGGKPRLKLEILHQGNYFKWRKEDMFLLEQICSLVDVALSGNKIQEVPLAVEAEPTSKNSIEGSYQRLARYGNLLFIKINTNFQIIEILGDTKKILGIEAKELLKNVAVWQRFIEPEDLKRLRRDFARMRFMQQEFREEIKVKSMNLPDGRLLFVQVIPITDESGKTLFWEGFALDVTDKRNAEKELRNQSKRIEALYEVAQSTQVYHDPALIMLKGLRAIIKATNSDCGLGCFYDGKTNKIELAALEGLSELFIQEVEPRIGESTLINRCIKNKESMLFKNIQEEPMALIDLVRKEGLKSTMVVPLILDDEVRGVLFLYCRASDRYSQNDINLVNAAATQIAIASRQAEYFIAEKQQSQYMTLLYRISHELSKYLTAKEITQHSIPLIQKQFSCKRVWIGVINEQGTHLVGTAGYGPSIRRRLIEMQIELYLRHDYLDEALKTSKPVIVKAGEEMECSGLNNIIRRLQIGTFVILPLVALNQTVGAIILEPAFSSEALIEKNLSLLTTISHEIATTILGRKFESKITEAEKMRMAGLLASGVAHNFNNLLQAVMGQASLLEMQLPKDSGLSKSARTIVEAAGKGAGLVNQLLNFSSQDSQARRDILVKSMLDESIDLYKSMLGSEVSLNLTVEEGLPKIEADYSQLQQVMSNLLLNAKDALEKRIDPKISIKASHTKLLSGEIDPDLSPGEYVRIDVEDNGAGMDEERQRRCFEPFYSSKNLENNSAFGFPGSGLGLSYAYSIMKQHNGIITVRSQPNQGTVFSLYFPVPKPQLLLKEADGGAAGVSQVRAVYLCELEISIQHTIKPIFESLGLKCYNFSTNSRNEKLTSNGIKNLSAIVIDVDKESFQTIPFLQSIHKQYPESLMVILTQDIRRWSNILSAYKNLYTVSKPLNVWGIHALARKIISHNKNNSLNQKVTVVETSLENGKPSVPMAGTEKPPEDGDKIGK